MKSEIELITIGSELLSGRTLNSHAQTLGTALTAIGLCLMRDTTVPDEISSIQSAVCDAFRRTDIVIVSGGLGPTSDDITRDALAGIFNRNIVISPEAWTVLHERFKQRNRTVTPAAERQAFILEGAITLINSVGAAPGERLELPGGKILFILPGPPNEFAAVLNDHFIPWLRGEFSSAVPNELRILTTQGVGESDIVTLLESVGFECPAQVQLGFYPGFGKVEIRLTAPPEHIAELENTAQVFRKLFEPFLI
ncbi:MAG: molybdopterin-binding protein [Kiritimatiellales bacterium]